MKNSLIQQSGFTLIEMLFTVSIIGMILLVTIPNFQRGRDRERLRAVAQELETNLRQAQQLTIGQRVATNDPMAPQVAGVGIHIEEPNNLYMLFRDDDHSGNYTIGEETSRVTLPAKVFFQPLEAPCDQIQKTCDVTFDTLTGSVDGLASSEALVFGMQVVGTNDMRTVTVHQSGLITSE